MKLSPSKAFRRHPPGDFTANPRVLILMAVAVLIGVLSTGAAWLLIQLINFCTNLFYSGHFSLQAAIPSTKVFGWLSVLIPIIGGLLIGLMARFGSEKIRGHGIPEAIEAILIGKSRISPRVAILKPLSSAISIGTGGPFGAEGPIIMTGGAIGSLLAQMIHLSSTERKALLVAGAAAGMTAIFGTPVAALLLAVELLLFEWKPRSLLPVLVAVAATAALRPLLFGTAAVFPFSGSMPTTLFDLPWWALIGIIAGLGSALLTMLVYASEDAFQTLPIHWMWWPAIGGLVIGIGGLIEPAALGIGYQNIRYLLAGGLSPESATWLLVVKAIIWAVALGSGTSGGVLAPLLIFGGCAGAILSPVLPAAAPGFWPLLGMAAIMGGTMRAPLTATLFAVELTGDSHAMLPLLVANGMAFATTVLLLKRSILTEKIARRGLHITREYEADPFALTWVKDVMVRDVDSLPATMNVSEAISFFISASRRHKSYPIVDAQRRVVGMLSRGDILSWTTQNYGQDSTINILDALETDEVVTGRPNDLVSELADRMAAAEIGRAPVVDPEGRLVGLVARKDLLAARARRTTEEQDRAILLKAPWTSGRATELNE